MTYFLLGCIVGLIIGVFIGANISPDTINNIGKIKRNNGDIQIDQNQNKEPKKGLFKRIFTRKNKKS